MKNINKEVDNFYKSIRKLGSENDYTLEVDFHKLENLKLIVSALFIQE